MSLLLWGGQSGGLSYKCLPFFSPYGTIWPLVGAWPNWLRLLTVTQATVGSSPTVHPKVRTLKSGLFLTGGPYSANG